jgi:two-component system, CitB family, sensor kinase
MLLRQRDKNPTLRSNRLSLAGQFLLLQLMIVLAVLLGVLAISLAQSARDFERVEGRRALSAAETLAALPAVRALVPDAEPRVGAALPAAAESVRTISGSSYALLAKRDGRILTSQDPAKLGSIMDFGDSQVRDGRAWTGLVTTDGVAFLAAQVPILDDAGTMVGIAAVGRQYPSVWERLGQATPNLLTYLGVSSVVGLGGSLLLSRRVKRQTLGMEPNEISGLVEHREALLHGVKEGVLALDPGLRITVANDSARELLQLPGNCVGSNLADLSLSPELHTVLTVDQPGPDQLVLVGERMVAFNRMPIRSGEQLLGSVTTLRDRTELSTLEQELGATRTITDTLRAQTHEFANQLHTISGLIQLEEYDEVVRFVDGVSSGRSRLHENVTQRIQDPSLAALLIAKVSLASERNVSLRLQDASALGRLDEELSRDLSTVVGNLIDNAMDAAAGQPEPRVEVLLTEERDQVTVRVRDSGPGVPPERFDDVFRQGFSTKNAPQEAGRGFGLAITRLVCRRNGGDVTVHNEGGAHNGAGMHNGGGAHSGAGAVFTAILRKSVQTHD